MDETIVIAQLEDQYVITRTQVETVDLEKLTNICKEIEKGEENVQTQLEEIKKQIDEAPAKMQARKESLERDLELLRSRKAEFMKFLPEDALEEERKEIG